MPLHKIAFLAIIGATIVLTLITYASTHWVQVTEVRVEVRGLPADLDGLRILHLTDWHNRSTSKTHVDVLAAVGEEHFDLICLTGDLVESQVSQVEPVVHVLVQLRRAAPIFSVIGNHDWSAGGPQVIQALKEAGVESLENTSTSIEIRGVPLTLVGVSDFYSRRSDVDAAFSEASEAFNLVLTHDPRIFPLVAERGPSLVLAGHTHGGQIRLPFFGTLYAPGQGFFPEYGDGLYWEDRSVLYISRGIGYTSILPFRFWNRPEITLLTLHRQD